MILFSPAKINIGLYIIERRPDGFHNLQSVMYPLGLSDILEIQRAGTGSSGLEFSQTGIRVDGGSGNNLCEKAYWLMAQERVLPPVRIHLHKQIPVGAGLGGGSSDASHTLKGLNQLFQLSLSPDKLHEMAAALGSDCPFFLHRKAMMMEGRGELLSPSEVNLESFHIVLLFPRIHISTADAYAGIVPAIPDVHLRQLVGQSVDRWKSLVINDFERSVFALHPELEDLKNGLYESGALYASLSGSGSSLYGIFRNPPDLPRNLEQLVVWKGMPGIPARVT